MVPPIASTTAAMKTFPLTYDSHDNIAMAPAAGGNAWILSHQGREVDRTVLGIEQDQRVK